MSSTWVSVCWSDPAATLGMYNNLFQHLTWKNPILRSASSRWFCWLMVWEPQAATAFDNPFSSFFFGNRLHQQPPMNHWLISLRVEQNSAWQNTIYISGMFLGVFISQQTPSVDDDTLMLANSNKNAHPFPLRVYLILPTFAVSDMI